MVAATVKVYDQVIRGYARRAPRPPAR
jgi:hypothetical protein